MAHEALQQGTSLYEGFTVPPQRTSADVPFDSRMADTLPYGPGESPEKPPVYLGPEPAQDMARPLIENMFVQAAEMLYQTTSAEARIAQRKHLRQQVAAHYADGQLRLPRDRDATNAQEVVFNYVERELETRIGKIAMTRLKRPDQKALVERSHTAAKTAFDTGELLLQSSKQVEALFGDAQRGYESVRTLQIRIAAARENMKDDLSPEKLAEFDSLITYGSKTSPATDVVLDSPDTTDEDFAEIVDRDDLGPAPQSGGVPTVPMDMQHAA